MEKLATFAVRRTAVTAAVFILFSAAGLAQYTPASDAPRDDATTSAVHELQGQVRELRALVEQMRSENTQSRAEMQQLRQQLQETRKLLEPFTAASNSPSADAETALPNSSTSAAASQTASSSTHPDLENRVQKLEESTQLLGAKVDEQHQTKLETATKYRARLYGIVLMNAFRNVGGADNLDFPNVAQQPNPGDPSASFGATLRQSEIGLEVFGPTVAGARTSAQVQMDFAGGFPAVGNGVNFGLARLQTASARFDWAHTSVVVGQDSLFVSPLSPTSFASLAVPTFAYAGNLWGWIPQIRVEHRFDLSDQHTFTIQGGILDNLNWEPPSDPYFRMEQAGERSGRPAVGARMAWSQPLFGRPLSIGVAGYYTRQNWSWGRYLDGWAGMTDWQIPLAPRLTLSGEFYRGRAAGGIGAAISRPVVFGGSLGDPFTVIRGLDSAGGWAQLKLEITPKLEMNGSFAQDNAYAIDIRGFAVDANNFGPIIGRNRGQLANFIYHPRSDLVLAAEFRRLLTFPVYSSSSVTNQVNLSVGVLF